MEQSRFGNTNSWFVLTIPQKMAFTKLSLLRWFCIYKHAFTGEGAEEMVEDMPNIGNKSFMNMKN
jgi:hypothetical protein